MNADRMANMPAKKSLKNKALGTVLINIQKNPIGFKMCGSYLGQIG